MSDVYRLRKAVGGGCNMKLGLVLRWRRELVEMAFVQGLRSDRVFRRYRGVVKVSYAMNCLHIRGMVYLEMQCSVLRKALRACASMYMSRDPNLLTRSGIFPYHSCS